MEMLSGDENAWEEAIASLEDDAVPALSAALRDEIPELRTIAAGLWWYLPGTEMEMLGIPSRCLWITPASVPPPPG